MFRGIKTTLESLGRSRFVKTHTPALGSKSRPLPSLNEPLAYDKQLSELRDYVSFATELSEREEDLCAIDISHELYLNRYGCKDGGYHVVFGWLYRMSETFLERLQKCGPIPLIIFAHFVVLMHDMERFWYMKGWTHHVMGGIFEALDVEYRVWI